MQSAILEKVDLEETKKVANVFGIDLKTATVDGKLVLVLPENKAELKKVLRFLDEDYFQSSLLSTPHLSNSKRLVSVG
jgi:hydrogenase maturation factor